MPARRRGRDLAPDEREIVCVRGGWVLLVNGVPTRVPAIVRVTDRIGTVPRSNLAPRLRDAA